MSEVIEEDNITGLVEVKKATVLAAFTNDDGLNSVVQQAKDLVAGFDHDMSTGASRKRTGSLANKVAKLKTGLDAMGKDLVADWKTKAKAVDKSRKQMRDDLDELKILARKPLTDWEAEQEEIEAQRVAKEAADKLAAEIESGHELGLLLNADHDREIAEQKRIKQEAEEEAQRVALAAQVEKDKEIARLAAEKATRDAEDIAKAKAKEVEQENQRVIKMAQDAREAKEQADRDKIAAQEREKLQAEQAEKDKIAAQAKADQDALDAAENARLTEVKRQEDEAAQVEADRVEREKNKAHIGKVRKKVKEQLMQFANIDEETAKRVVLAVKNIDDLNITY